MLGSSQGLKGAMSIDSTINYFSHLSGLMLYLKKISVAIANQPLEPQGFSPVLS